MKKALLASTMLACAAGAASADVIPAVPLAIVESMIGAAIDPSQTAAQLLALTNPTLQQIGVKVLGCDYHGMAACASVASSLGASIILNEGRSGTVDADLQGVINAAKGNSSVIAIQGPWMDAIQLPFAQRTPANVPTVTYKGVTSSPTNWAPVYAFQKDLYAQTKAVLPKMTVAGPVGGGYWQGSNECLQFTVVPDTTAGHACGGGLRVGTKVYDWWAVNGILDGPGRNERAFPLAVEGNLGEQRNFGIFDPYGLYHPEYGINQPNGKPVRDYIGWDAYQGIAQFYEGYNGFFGYGEQTTFPFVDTFGGASIALLETQDGVSASDAAKEAGILGIETLLRMERKEQTSSGVFTEYMWPAEDWGSLDRGFYDSAGNARPLAIYMQTMLAFLGTDTNKGYVTSPATLTLLRKSGGAVDDYVDHNQNVAQRSTDGHWFAWFYKDMSTHFNSDADLLIDFGGIARSGRLLDVQSGTIVSFSGKTQWPFTMCLPTAITQKCVYVAEFY